MKLNELKPNPGARKDKIRVGRGHAGRRGKQAGKGQSGQNKRGGTRPGFEGGQNPWFRRVPKRGFTNVNHIEYQVINLHDLETSFEANDKVNLKTLYAKKLARKKTMPVKLLAQGKLTKKLTIKVSAVSQNAIEAVEAAGGKLEVY